MQISVLVDFAGIVIYFKFTIYLNEIMIFSCCYRLGRKNSTSEFFWWKSVVSVRPYVIDISQFWLPLHNNYMSSQQTYHKYSSRNSEESFQRDSKCKMAALVSDWQNYCMWSHQTCQKCSSVGPEKVLLLFFDGLEIVDGCPCLRLALTF